MKTLSGIVLAFDDGRVDNYRIWKEVLEPLNIPATFNITTAYNDGTQNGRYSPTTVPPMGSERVKEMSQSPFVEIGCHGREHICDPQDAMEGERILRGWINAEESTLLGYACPNSDLHIEDLNETEWNRFLYLRTGIRIKDHPLFRTTIRKLNRLVHIPILYDIGFSGCIMHKCKDRIMFSVAVLNDTKVEEILSLVKLAVRQKGHLILLFHSIGEISGTEKSWAFSDEKFRELCRQLLCMQEENRIKMMTTAQLYMLLKR